MVKSQNWALLKQKTLGKSLGLVVMGGDLCLEGHGFKSRRHILHGRNIYSHIFVVRIVMIV